VAVALIAVANTSIAGSTVARIGLGVIGAMIVVLFIVRAKRWSAVKYGIMVGLSLMFLLCAMCSGNPF
jgi:hypothetical protein